MEIGDEIVLRCRLVNVSQQTKRAELLFGEYDNLGYSWLVVVPLHVVALCLVRDEAVKPDAVVG